eukprot:m.166610 g.166610  ORF g.166610 m.166610 type:complete len:399 (+) comp12714_c0_seq1:328-1524(+)
MSSQLLDDMPLLDILHGADIQAILDGTDTEGMGLMTTSHDGMNRKTIEWGDRLPSLTGWNATADVHHGHHGPALSPIEMGPPEAIDTIRVDVDMLSPSVERIKDELRLIVDGHGPSTSHTLSDTTLDMEHTTTTTTTTTTTALDNTGVEGDGDSDDAMSDISRSTRSDGGVSPLPGRTTCHPKPRSGEALLSSITARERDLLLSKHGVTVPESLPLTKQEDRKIRGALRKIRNKASAQRSRRNKEAHTRGLEKRVEGLTRINIELDQKVVRLEHDKRTLLEQLNDLRRQLSASTHHASAGITVMMAVLCVGMQTTVPTPMHGRMSPSVTPQGFRARTLLSLEPEVDPEAIALAMVMRAVCCVCILVAILFAAFPPKNVTSPWEWVKSIVMPGQAKKVT